MSKPGKTKTVYRVESADGKLGLWRDADGTWNPKFHLLKDGKCRKMPMEDSAIYRKGGKRWFASAPTKELLKAWFSRSDLHDLEKHGFGIYEFEVSQWCRVSEAEVIFPRDAVVHRRQLSIGAIYPKGGLIQWPRAKYWDKAWNPVIGCRPVSPACDHCYAKALVSRWNMTGVNSPGFEPTWKENSKPPKKGVVFCGNMTDLFGEFVDSPSDFLLQTVENKATAYLYLTKRVGRMCDRLNDTLGFVDEEGGVHFQDYNAFDIANHYFGYTAETQEWFDRRQEESLGRPVGWAMPGWANLWYSLEPLLGPIQMGSGLVRRNLRWVVVGCESGRQRRPCKLEWVESVVEQCLSAGVPVFVKQLDLGGKCVTDIRRFPEHLRVRQVPWVGDRAGWESVEEMEEDE